MAPNVLVIDADPTAAEVTSACIARFCPQAKVQVRATPQAGWLALHPGETDMLIIDPAGSRPSADLLIRYARQTFPRLRIIVLASAPTPGLRSLMQQAGVDTYLEKPGLLPREEFELVMARLVERRRNGH